MRNRNLAKRPLVGLVVVATLLFAALPAFAGGRPLTAELLPENEVQLPPVDSDSSGFAEVTLNQGQGEVCFEIETTGFDSTLLAAHIHAGEAGVNGGVVVPLFLSTPDDPELITGCTEDVDADLIKDIRQNPDGFYVNLHTVDYPGGEIRGQLSK